MRVTKNITAKNIIKTYVKHCKCYLWVTISLNMIGGLVGPEPVFKCFLMMKIVGRLF